LGAALKLSQNRFAAALSAGVTIGLAGVTLVASIGVALAECKPSHFRAPYFIRTMGACGFNSETLSFRGSPAQQAMCLMRGMDTTRNLGPMLEGLPPGLAKRVGDTTGLPSREALSAYLSKLDLEWDLAMNLWQPAARARDNDPDSPTVKYFVIHDTSGPYFGHRDFPGDINTNPKINNLKTFVCNDEWGKAHAVINRMGESLVNHDFSIPWRETKFEQAAEFGGALKGLFVHIEMIQPRRAGSGGGDGHSPDPAFTPAQYDRLALLYTVVSARAGHWLIPAFHAALDADIRNGHDDPLNFKIDNFSDSIDRLVDKLQGTGQAQAANGATATDAQPDAPVAAGIGFWVDALWGTPHKAPAAAVASAGAGNAADSAAPPDSAGAGAGAVTADVPATPALTAAALPAAAHAATAEKPPTAPAPPHVATAEKPPVHEPAREPPSHEKTADRDSHSSHHDKSAETCTTHRVKGHSHRVCEPERIAAEEPAKHSVRSVDREPSPHSEGTRHHSGDSHQHHAGPSGRHRRS
jgi:hypothetical protein